MLEMAALRARSHAAAFLEKGGPERDVAAADQGSGEVEGTHQGVETAGFEAVGVAVAGLDAFIAAGTDVFGAFHEHGGVHEQFGNFGEPFAEALLKKEVDEIMVGGTGGVRPWLLFFGSRLQQPVLGGHHNPRWGRRAAGQADPGFVAFCRQRFTLPTADPCSLDRGLPW